MNRQNVTYLLIGAALVLIGLFTVDFKGNAAGIINLRDFTPAEDATTASEVPINTLQDFNEALTSIVDETVPSVVTIKVSEKVEIQRSPFPRFFEGFDFFQRPGSGESQQRLRQGLGSGVIVSENGYILTNNHVIEGAESILVTLYNGREYEGKVIGSDPLTDIAMVKIDAENLNALSIGNSEQVNVGEMVLAIGSPLGSNLAHSVSFGIVSAKGRSIGILQHNNVGGYENFIQTDAAINPGNSGGALVNMSGQLIGINTAIASRSGGNQGIGFAVPSNLAKKIMRSLIEDGEVERAWLGISYGGAVDATMARALDIDEPGGVIVGSVLDGSPADEAGLQENDVIKSLNGEPIENWRRFRTTIGTSNPGEEIALGIIRDGERMEITVTLGQKPNDEMAAAQPPQDNLNETLGFSVENLNGRIAQELGLEANQTGVVVTDVSRVSNAFRQGLRRGDVITEVSNQPVESVSEFIETIQEIQGEDQVVLLKIIRAGNAQYIAFEL